MYAFRVVLVIARGTRLDTGQRVVVSVLAASRLDAAVSAERLADQALSDVEYAHARSVRLIPQREPVTMALAA